MKKFLVAALIVLAAIAGADAVSLDRTAEITRKSDGFLTHARIMSCNLDRECGPGATR